MRVYVIGLGIAMGILCLFQSYALGQTITDVPSNEKNTRFYTDHFWVKRPGLSINGFDNGGNDSSGFGLKQILNILYDGSGNRYDDSLEVETYKNIVASSNIDIVEPSGNLFCHLVPKVPLGTHNGKLCFHNKGRGIMRSFS